VRHPFPGDRTTAFIDRLTTRPSLAVRVIIASAVVTTLVGVLFVSTSPPRVFAVDVFGALRAPGEPAFIVAHRGDRSQAPENTMPALELGMTGPKGFVETDVQLTRDGVPVLFHDVDLERITGESVRISDLTLAEVRERDAGEWFGADFRGTPIPTLEEFLDSFRETDARALIELKAAWSIDDVRPVIALLERFGLRDRVVLQSFSLETLDSLQRFAPHYARILLIRELPAAPLPLASRLGIIGFGTTARSAAAQPAALEALHDAGIGVLCYTLNTQDSWAEVIGLGVDGIITDEPGELDAWLAVTAPGT
jgi:glycerophosphoryl diester phosphodiesterase